MTKRNLYSSAAILLAATLMFAGCGSTANTVSVSPTPSASTDVILDDTYTGSTDNSTSNQSSQLPDGTTPPEMPDGATPPEMPDGTTPPDMTAGATPNNQGEFNPNQSSGSGSSSEVTPASEEISATNITPDKQDTEVKDALSLSSASGVTSITFSGTTANVVGEGVKVNDGEIKIKEAGTYILSGTFNGEVIVNAKEADVNLILNGVTITSDDSAAIFVKNANKVVITLQEGTVNTLSDASEYVYEVDKETGELEDEPAACLYAKSDLTINGNGKLIVNGNFNDGIKSKDTLMLISGTYVVTAKDHGIVGKDLLLVKDGTYTITAGSDGMKSTNDNTNDEGVTEKGIVVIESGTIDITAGDDGVSAVTLLSVEGGNLTIKTGKGSANAEAKHDSFDRGFGGWGNNNSSTSSTDSDTPKGLVCDTKIQITGGTVNVDSEDDAVHSNSSFIMTGGDLTLAAGDDGIHSDDTLIISGGKVNVTKSYEGLEALSILVSGGEIMLNSDDDGINAAGESASGSMFGGFWGGSSSSSASLFITGGTIYVNAYGDGLDSNGTMEISGGYIFVEGPTNGGNAALDTDGEMLINGGTILAVGSTGMFESPSTNSTQNNISVACSTTSGNKIELTDSTGKVLVSFTTTRTLSSAVVTVSCPDITLGSTYTVSTGNTTTSVTVSSVVTNQGVSSMGGFGGGGFGGGGKQPGGNGGKRW